MKDRWLRWILVSAGFLGSAASVGLTQGIVVTALPQPMGIQSYLFTELYPIDLDGDQVPDFTFGAEVGFVGLRTERANQVIVRPSGPPDIAGPVARVEDGSEIGSSLDPQLAWISSDPVGGYVSPGEVAFAGIAMHLSTGTSSEWPGSPGARGFIGFQFEQPDGFHYGYFDVVMAAEAGGVLLGWAYNSVPNASVFASPVPEPSTWTLMGLSGALFWWYGRRKRTG